MKKLRIVVFLIAAVCFALLFLRSASDLPEFGEYKGPYGDIINARVESERHTPQSVAAITFDYRGFDTLCEEFIFFAAVAGALLLMRTQESEKKGPARDEAAGRERSRQSEAVRAVGMALFPFVFMMGIYIILHGHLTPGGGFQGGVLAASAFLFVYLCGEYRDLKLFTKPAVLDILEPAGASVYALLGTSALLAGGAFMENILPLGSTGELFSAGNLPVLNVAVGVEICSGFLLLISAFLEQTLIVRQKNK